MQANIKKIESIYDEEYEYIQITLTINRPHNYASRPDKLEGLKKTDNESIEWYNGRLENFKKAYNDYLKKSNELESFRLGLCDLAQKSFEPSEKVTVELLPFVEEVKKEV